MKMFVVDSSFSSVEGRVLLLFHHFPLRFQYNICKCSFVVLPPLQSQKNDMKFRKIKLKIWKDICMFCIKFFCRLNYQNSYTLRSSLENYTSKQFDTTLVNTRQHDQTTTQHETTQVQHETRRVQHEKTRDNTNTKQPQICFDLFISSLHARSRVCQAPKLCLCCKTQKTENRFFPVKQ